MARTLEIVEEVARKSLSLSLSSAPTLPDCCLSDMLPAAISLIYSVAPLKGRFKRLEGKKFSRL